MDTVYFGIALWQWIAGAVAGVIIGVTFLVLSNKPKPEAREDER